VNYANPPPTWAPHSPMSMHLGCSSHPLPS
jgi:hypothetical protein